jgi:hypothetical protein
MEVSLRLLRMIAATNNPAQWAFALAVLGETPSLEDIRKASAEDRIPVAMILKAGERAAAGYKCTLNNVVNPNSAGWKIAHIDGVGFGQSHGRYRSRRLSENAPERLKYGRVALTKVELADFLPTRISATHSSARERSDRSWNEWTTGKTGTCRLPEYAMSQAQTEAARSLDCLPANTVLRAG